MWGRGTVELPSWEEDLEACQSVEVLPMILLSVPSDLEALLREVSRDEGVDEDLRRKISDHLEPVYNLDDGLGKRRGVPPSVLASAAPYVIRRNSPGYSLFDLTQGGRFFFPQETKPIKTEEEQASYEERRKQLLLLQEQRDYARMTSNIQRTPRETVRDIQATFKFQAGMGANMVLAVASAFILSYWASRYVVGTGKTSHRLVIGLAGAVFILLVEILVFVVRSIRADEALERARQEAEASTTNVGVHRGTPSALLGTGNSGRRGGGGYVMVPQNDGGGGG